MKEIKTKFWMPVTKDKSTGEYFAVLSDDSIDRDEEGMDKNLIRYWGKNKALPSLANHENKMEKWVGGWNDIKTFEKDGNFAVGAKPWFFSKEANPLAAQIQKQVDEAIAKGLHPGISVGAIITDYKMVKVNGVEKRIFTKGELLEATWVPIQSNRNATYGHIAKKFGMTDIDKNMEVGNMTDETFTQKDIDTAVEKSVDEINKKVSILEKQVSDKDSEIAKLQKEVEESGDDKEEAEEKAKEAEKKVDEAEKALKAEKKASLEKAKLVADEAEKQIITDKKEIEKEMSEGKLPISRM